MRYRRAGQGGSCEIGDRLYEGRHTPTNADGKRETHTVYAPTRDEAKLSGMIAEVKARIAEDKRRKKEAAPTS